jgi:quinol monooxygenase YgiN
MTFRSLGFAALCFVTSHALPQAPAAPPPAIPDNVSPLYVVTYVEVRPNAKDEAAALLKSYRDASRGQPGNLRSIVVQRMRPGQFVVIAAWQNKAAWDAHLAAAATQDTRARLNAIRNAPADDRFHNALSVGPMDDPQAPGAIYVVTHVDVIPPQRENAVAALKVLGDAVRASAGNIRYEIVQQTNRPNHFTVVEIWRSRDAFDASTMAEPQRAFRDKLAAWTGALYDERLYRRLD